MQSGNVILSSLFVLGILLSMVADKHLRYRHSPSWRQGFVAVAGVGLTFLACAYAIR
jgi:hypothetical protein